MKNMTGAIYVAGPLDYETRRRVSRNQSREMDCVRGRESERDCKVRAEASEEIWRGELQLNLFAERYGRTDDKILQNYSNCS